MSIPTQPFRRGIDRQIRCSGVDLKGCLYRLNLFPSLSPIPLLTPLLSISLFLGIDGIDSRANRLQHKGFRCLNLVSLPRLIHTPPVPSPATVVSRLTAIFLPSADLLDGSGELHLVIPHQFLSRLYACTDQDFVAGVWSCRIAWPLQPAGDGANPWVILF